MSTQSSRSSRSKEKVSEMKYLDWDVDEDDNPVRTFDEWKTKFEKKNKIDPVAETIEALDKQFKLNRYSTV